MRFPIRWWPLLLIPAVTSCHVARYFYWNFAGLNDVDKFPTLPVAKGESTFYFPQAKQALDPATVTSGTLKNGLLQDLEDAGTAAFLVVHKDSLVLEQYFNGYEDTTLLTTFSMAKSFISALVGIAVEEGNIRDIQQTVGEFLPFIDNEEVKKVTIENLLNMTSGIKYNEGYFNPFGDVAVSYYGINLKKHVSKLDMDWEQGTNFKYISINTQLLSMIVEQATGKSINAYASEKLWQPMEAEFPGSWSTDSKKHQLEKAFCCWNARARDYAKFGRLYLNGGNWNGQQLVPQAWVDRSAYPTKHGIRPYYSYQWWHTVNHTDRETGKVYSGDEVFELFRKGDFGNEEKYILTPLNDFYARGILGQFIYVYPEKELIIVRIGKKMGHLNWPKLFSDIAQQV